MSERYWWRCTVIITDGAREGTRCGDVMAYSLNPADVERDRDAHLRERHPGATLPGHLMGLAHWPTATED